MPGEEQLPNLETKSGTAFAVEWLIDHENEFVDDPGLSDSIQALKEIREVIDSNLDLDPDRKTEILKASFFNFLEINSIPVTAKEAALLSLAGNIEAIKGEIDARGDWWESFRRQSKEGKDNLSSTLLKQAGTWKAAFELATPLPDSGARELQTAVSQFLVDIAGVVSKTATKPFKYVPELDGSGQQELQQNAREYVETVNQISIKSGDLQTFNPLIYVENGNYFYREVANFTSANIRLMREKNGQCEYLDLPANVFLSQDAEALNNDLKQIELNDNYNWENIDTLVEETKRTPIISISIADNPSPESKLYLYARSGKSIVHLNYNPARHKMEIYFNHLSFDGISGTDFALGMASAVGTPNKDKMSGLSIDWHPPTQNQELTESLLNIVISRTDESLFGSDFENDTDIIRFVQGLELSDFSFTNDLDPMVYKNIEDLTEKINKLWHQDISDKIDKIIEQDKKEGKTIPDSQSTKEIKNRLLSTKMTPVKFLDIVTREYFGSSVFCNTTRDLDARLTVCQPPVIEKIKTNTLEKVFGLKDKEKAKRELEELERAHHRLSAEFARAYLMNFSPIVGLQSQTDWFRRLGENTSEVLSGEVLEATMLIAMTSTLPELVRGDTRLSDFSSALTTSKEKRFAFAIGNIPLTLESGQKTIRYSHRIRHNPHTINSLDFFALKPDELNEILKQTKTESINDVREVLLEVAKETYDSFDTKKDRPNNILLIAKTLKKRPDLKKSLEVVIAAATIKAQDQFYVYAKERAQHYTDLFEKV